MKLRRLLFALAVSAAGLFSARPAAAAVPVVAHEPGYYTSLASHAARWLRDEGIASEVIPVASMGSALAKARIALLVGFASPTETEMRQLRDFRARGGKLVVFYSSSPALASLMGVKPIGYRAAAYAGQWSRMLFPGRFPDGIPPSILQTSSVLQRAVPVKGKGRVLAWWADRTGKNTGDAAWIATTSGYWMTHVLLADGDEHLKARLLGALVGSLDPKLWNWPARQAKEAKENQALVACAKAQVPVRGEIHAVWDHSGCGLYPGDWPKTFRTLAASKVTDLFVNVAGAGFAHYQSAVLPQSKTFEQEGDQLAACVKAARGTGVRVHAWVLCFTGTRSTPARLEEFGRRGWRLKDRRGRMTEYLNPSLKGVRDHVLAAIDEIQSRYAVDGVHLDFVRWYEEAARPANAAAHVSNFVAEARRRVKRPKWLTAAVFGLYPSCVGRVGQDWDSWIASGIVDYVVPMDYTESNTTFESYVAQHAAVKSHARRVIAGIGVTANESRLDARQVIEQAKIARRYGLAGVALFDLDTLLEKRVLPYLRIGLW